MSGAIDFNPDVSFAGRYYEITGQASATFKTYLYCAAAESRRRMRRRKTPIVEAVGYVTWVHRWEALRAKSPSKTESVLELWPTRKDQRGLRDDNVPPIVFYVDHVEGRFDMRVWASGSYVKSKLGKRFMGRVLRHKLAN